MGDYVITISPDGSEIKTEANGFSDSKCLEGMDKVFEKLGDVEVDKKPEAHVHNNNTINQR